MNIYLAKDEAIFIYTDDCNKKDISKLKTIPKASNNSYTGMINNMLFMLFFDKRLDNTYKNEGINKMSKDIQNNFFTQIDNDMKTEFKMMEQSICKEKSMKTFTENKIPILTIFTGIPKKAYISLFKGCK